MKEKKREKSKKREKKSKGRSAERRGTFRLFETDDEMTSRRGE